MSADDGTSPEARASFLAGLTRRPAPRQVVAFVTAALAAHRERQGGDDHAAEVADEAERVCLLGLFEAYPFTRGPLVGGELDDWLRELFRSEGHAG